MIIERVSPFHIRVAVSTDVEVIARQRAAMFDEIRSVPADVFDSLEAASRIYLAEAIPGREYVGWVASPRAEPGRIVAGAGVQVRRVMPFPQWIDGRVKAAIGLQAIVLNVYTEPEFRRQGLARSLMYEVLGWAKATGIESLILHAAPAGRALYEALGFSQTSEMRFQGDLSVWTRPLHS